MSPRREFAVPPAGYKRRLKEHHHPALTANRDSHRIDLRTDGASDEAALEACYRDYSDGPRDLVTPDHPAFAESQQQKQVLQIAEKAAAMTGAGRTSSRR
jgi:hypothetical protein